jgi:hypothetical protein
MKSESQSKAHSCLAQPIGSPICAPLTMARRQRLEYIVSILRIFCALALWAPLASPEGCSSNWFVYKAFLALAWRGTASAYGLAVTAENGHWRRK